MLLSHSRISSVMWELWEKYLAYILHHLWRRQGEKAGRSWADVRRRSPGPWAWAPWGRILRNITIRWHPSISSAIAMGLLSVPCGNTGWQILRTWYDIYVDRNIYFWPCRSSVLWWLLWETAHYCGGGEAADSLGWSVRTSQPRHYELWRVPTLQIDK